MTTDFIGKSYMAEGLNEEALVDFMDKKPDEDRF